MSDIKVRIYGEFNDRAFRKAGKSTSILEKSFKRSGIAAASFFSVQKVIQFGKESVKAFLDDDKAAKRLTKTLENLGLAFEDPRLKVYLSNLERQSGIVDDKLRPSLQKLITTTGSVSKSQELLSLAI